MVKVIIIILAVLVILGLLGAITELMEDSMEHRNSIHMLRNSLLDAEETIAKQGMKISALEEDLKTVSEAFKQFRDSAGIRLANVENNTTLNKKRIQKVMGQALMFDTSEYEEKETRNGV